MPTRSLTDQSPGSIGPGRSGAMSIVRHPTRLHEPHPIPACPAPHDMAQPGARWLRVSATRAAAGVAFHVSRIAGHPQLSHVDLRRSVEHFGACVAGPSATLARYIRAPLIQVYGWQGVPPGPRSLLADPRMATVRSALWLMCWGPEHVTRYGWPTGPCERPTSSLRRVGHAFLGSTACPIPAARIRFFSPRRGALGAWLSGRRTVAACRLGARHRRRETGAAYRARMAGLEIGARRRAAIAAHGGLVGCPGRSPDQGRRQSSEARALRPARSPSAAARWAHS